MSEGLLSQISQGIGQTWNSWVSQVEAAVGQGESKAQAAVQSTKAWAVDTFQASNPMNELNQVTGNRPRPAANEPSPKSAPKPESPPQAKSPTGLKPKLEGDAPAYQKLDKNMDQMLTQTKASIDQCLDIKPGQKLPADMKVKIGVSTDASGHKTLRVLSVEPQGHFRHRNNKYLNSVASRDVPSVGVPAYVDMKPITDDCHAVTYILKADGGYELVQPEGLDAQVPADSSPSNSV